MVDRLGGRQQNRGTNLRAVSAGGQDGRIAKWSSNEVDHSLLEEGPGVVIVSLTFAIDAI